MEFTKPSGSPSLADEHFPPNVSYNMPILPRFGNLMPLREFPLKYLLPEKNDGGSGSDVLDKEDTHVNG